MLICRYSFLEAYTVKNSSGKKPNRKGLHRSSALELRSIPRGSKHFQEELIPSRWDQSLLEGFIPSGWIQYFSRKNPNRKGLHRFSALELGSIPGDQTIFKKN